MKKLNTKHSTQDCAAFEKFMIEIGQWKINRDGRIEQTGNFRTAKEIEDLWKKRLAKIKEHEKKIADKKQKEKFFIK